MVRGRTPRRGRKTVGVLGGEGRVLGGVGVEGGEKEREEQERQRLEAEMGAQRMQLISPPPEETLSLRRHSVSS